MASVLIVVAVLLVLGFAALGVRDTLKSGTSIRYRVATGVLRAAVIALATIGLFDTLRGSTLTGVRTLGSAGRALPVTHPAFRSTMELLTGTPLMPHGDARVLSNGDETYSTLWADLRAAKRSIAIQLYYCAPGRMADQMADILRARVRDGVRVFLLVDAFGSQGMPRSWYQALQGAGVEIAVFRPLRWYSLNRINNRSHVRAVAIDGVIGYTGGFGLADKWFGDGRTPGQWRETNVRFTGPAVSQLLAAFAVSWAEATGDLLTVDESLVPAAEADTSVPASVSSRPANAASGPVAGLLYTPASLGLTRAERFLSLSIAAARQRLYIANAYFVPDGGFRRALEEAAARGVDVRVLTAGPETDVSIMWYGGRARYTELLAAGVRIYEYKPTMMHAKTMVVDGLWSSIGSMNFDNRSMVLNDEANFVALDAALGARLEEIFTDDLRLSDEIRLAEFDKRPWWHRPREWAANLLSRVL